MAIAFENLHPVFRIGKRRCGLGRGRAGIADQTRELPLQLLQGVPHVGLLARQILALIRIARSEWYSSSRGALMYW